MIMHNLGTLLHHCSKTKALTHGTSLHAIAIKTGLQSNLIISNHILNMYAKCTKMHHARKLFDEMPQRNLVSWSAMIAGYDQANNPYTALDLFSRIEFPPNEFVYASILSACASLSWPANGKQVHGHSVKSGYEMVLFVSNALITMYMSCGLCSDAFSVFNRIFQPSTVSWNAIVTGFVENMELERGFDLYKLMQQNGVFPDKFSFVGVFGICTCVEELQKGRQLHCQTVKHGFDDSAFVGNVILTMYSKCGSIGEAEKAFDSIVEKDVISWNTIVSSCSHSGDYDKALGVFREMTDMCIEADDFTYSSVFAGCAGLASMRNGAQIHAHLIRTRVSLDVGVGNSIVNMYAKCGSIGYAVSVFDRMTDRNLVSWNTMIVAFGNHGYGRETIEKFEQMRVDGVVPDSVTFIGLLAACNHSGMVEQGRFLFNLMQEGYGIKPETEHFTCLIDLLGRAGHLEEAEHYAKMVPTGSDLVVWGSLLSACRLYGDIGVGKRIADNLMELRPQSTSPFVLISNLCAAEGRWDAVAEVRKMMKGSGVKKEPGHSFIDVNGVVEKFTVGDFSHSRMEEIGDMLGGWNLVAKEGAL